MKRLRETLLALALIAFCCLLVEPCMAVIGWHRVDSAFVRSVQPALGAVAIRPSGAQGRVTGIYAADGSAIAESEFRTVLVRTGTVSYRVDDADHTETDLKFISRSNFPAFAIDFYLWWRLFLPLALTLILFERLWTHVRSDQGTVSPVRHGRTV